MTISQWLFLKPIWGQYVGYWQASYRKPAGKPIDRLPMPAASPLRF